MNKILIAALAATLSGCAGTTFENRVTCSVSEGETFVVSKWGSFGITSKISDKDAAVICPKEK